MSLFRLKDVICDADINKAANIFKSVTEKQFKCEFCSMQFQGQYNLERHWITHTQKALSCKVCDKRFRREKNLKLHMLVHSGQEPHECGVCRRRFARRTSFLAHLQAHKNKDNNFCKICNINVKQLKTHTKLHFGEEKPYHCKVCGKRFAGQNWLNKHLLMHEKIKLRKNEVKNQVDISKPVNSCTKKQFDCEFCFMQFCRQDSLEKHWITHTEKALSCEVCNKRFRKEKNLKLHMLAHSGQGPHECGVCRRRFVFRQSLVCHLRAHKNKDNNFCEICNINVKRLKPHMELHMGDKPYICKVCGKRFAQQNLLDQHLLMHEKFHKCEDKTYSVEDEFKCYVCERMFNTINGLKSHIGYLHADKTPVKCEKCDQSFAGEKVLKAHLAHHIVYYCNVCRVRFYKHSDLIIHEKIHV